MVENKWLFWTCLGVTGFLSISLFCFNKIARRVPINYICLLIFTLCTSYLLASVCIFQSAENILIAATLTMTVFVALTVFTFFTKNDISIIGGLGVILCHMLIIMIPLFIIFTSRWVFILICIIVILIVSIFIIYDTQMIAGGRKYGLDYNDYVVAALLLYTVRIQT